MIANVYYLYWKFYVYIYFYHTSDLYDRKKQTNC